MASSTDKQLTRQANLGAQSTATNIGGQGQTLSNIGTQWGLSGLSDLTNLTKGNIDPNAVATNRQGFQNSMDVTQGMIGQIASRPGGYTPGEVSSMKLAATSPISSAARTAQGQMTNAAARTGNAASLNPAIASTNRQAGMDLSGALAGVQSTAAEARRQDTLANTSMALNAQEGQAGKYQSQMGTEAGLTSALQGPANSFLGLNQTGLNTQLGANAQNVDVASLLGKISTTPGLWSQIAAGLAGGAKGSYSSAGGLSGTI